MWLQSMLCGTDKNASFPLDNPPQHPSHLPSAANEGGNLRRLRFAVLAAEAPISALVLFAMDGLAHLRLSPGEFLVCWSPWLVGLGLTAAVTRRRPHMAGWRIVLLQSLAAGIGLGLVSPGLRHPLALGTVAVATLFVAVLTLAWRFWLGRAERRGAHRGAEAVRLILVGGTAVGVMLPFFSDRWIGGVDARWYAYMLTDYLEQLRAGVFPVLTGQGEFAHNGGVHPFRSAPVYLWCAGLWDVLTGRSLSVMALQHLTVITSALAGALGMYAAVTALAAPRRWLAAGVAVIYVSSPAFLGPLYFADQYMTYMALGALPALLYGNARMFETGGRAGWPWLAIGLAAVWFCHPPVAILCSLVTGLIQGGALLLTRAPGRHARQLLQAAGLFLLLAGHYFVAMSEVPSPLQPSVLLMVLQLAGGACALVGLVRGVIWGERWGWLALAAGAAILGWAQRAWALPLVIATGAMMLVAALARARRWFEPGEHAWALTTGAAGFGLVLAQLVWRAPFPGYSVDTLALLGRNTESWAEFLRPVTTIAGGAGAVQPGWGVLLLAALLAAGALGRASLRPRLFFVASFLLVASCFKLPGLSEFWLAHLPRALTEMAGLPLVNRLMPPFAALACLGGALALAELAVRNITRYRVALAVLLITAGVSAGLAWPYLRRGWAVTHTRQDTANQFRTENAVLDRFAYDLMMMPGYVSNGKVDPRLEGRLFVRTREVRIGPDEIAQRMEAVDGREHLLTATVEPTAPAWLNLQPELTLAPGEHLLLRFEFLPKEYAGWLFFIGRHIYREYHLPDAGWQDAFGVGQRRSKTLSLWNSGPETEVVRMSFQRPAASGEFGDFGRLFVSHYRPELAPVRVLSLRPYRVEVTMPTPGWLESPRAYLPGYTAKVDGREVATDLSPRWLVRVPLEAGRHLVELEYRGTWIFRITWWLSAAAWAGTLVWLARRPA